MGADAAIGGAGSLVSPHPTTSVLPRLNATLGVMSERDPRFQPPDAATLAWAAHHFSSDAVVVVRRLGGGLDAATHLVRSKEGTEAVLRRATRPHHGRRDEEFRMERDQLTKLQGTGLPVAVPLGADLNAVHTDVSALLVSRLPGRLTTHGSHPPRSSLPWHRRRPWSTVSRCRTRSGRGMIARPTCSAP